MFYLQLFRALERQKVRYLLVGGVAVNLHGAERMTMDVDLMLAMDGKNLERFRAVARSLRLAPAVLPVTLEQFCDPKTVASWVRDKHMLAFQLRSPELEAPSVDILVKPVVSFQSAYRRRKRMKVEDVSISVAASEDLIALKSGTGRKVDESDILALRRLKRLRGRTRGK
ncbi:MAG: hypothetical protein AABM33_09595 [Pseudomonadota bacterium]